MRENTLDPEKMISPARKFFIQDVEADKGTLVVTTPCSELVWSSNLGIKKKGKRL